MASGKVKWFNNAKGYGFINEDGKTDDLFAHYSAIQMDGYKTLKAGQSVNFEIIQGPKGLHATEIKGAGKDAQQTSEKTPGDTIKA
ncbi:cold shock domain-containing protein CspD [Pantoea sp. Cy-639]|uniref:cold shock domain-containing protein CspD n=1 Tax=Pantoea sp. Cy-639 TaxID=2608360 RepID=UPI001422F811|nr:cold shock domain-containing protein CspD [Pantoea sp. Cy-639]NIF15694.1 cold shock domain-containing protein CspD [Pantoea sp. Cy-639]